MEFLIVVVILGVVFLATLKGTALVQVAKASATVYEIQRIQQNVQEYLTEFRRLPGDDGNAPERWRRPEALYRIDGRFVSFADDGVIQGELSDFLQVNGEQFAVWRDLRFAGILDGDPALAGESAQPQNLFNGTYGFAEDNFGLKQVLCVTQVPGQVALMIDRQLDDGNPATGNVRATSKWDTTGVHNHFNEPDVAAYSPDKTYIICLPYLP